MKHVYELLAGIVRIWGKPSGLNEGAISRVFLTFGALRLVWSEYTIEKPARPWSGDAIAITESLWIYTTKRAWGLGFIRPWARLYNLDIEIAGSRYSTEDGNLELHPPVKLQGVGGHRDITVHNSGHDAKARVKLWVYLHGNPIHPTPDDEDLCALVEIDSIPPHKSQIIPVSACHAVGAVIYRIDPDRSEPASVARLFGRPEWEPYPE